MNTPQPRRQVPEIKFRVLIIGRANAGKTSILQRVCETTESPVIYRGKGHCTWFNFFILTWGQRGEHTIDDELVFSNHTGYIFHDSCGVESGSTEELAVVQEFIRRKCGEMRLRDKLHAIWYCIPMDNHRPELDMRFFNNICPDQNVPVVPVFTKYDQFRRNVKIDLDDYGNPNDDVSEVAEKRFQEHYLCPLGDHVGFVRLEREFRVKFQEMHRNNRRCYDLIEKAAAVLNEDTVALMLLTVQRSNLELSVKTALNRLVRQLRRRSE
ncbi:GTP-binding protein [Lactarius vividus]|nr:GTP-binding protein [Lactarius vividus]